MKKLMFAISLAGLLGFGASAEVQSANTFGVLKVTSSTKQTIIAVPWVKVGAGSPIKVADLVMTSNLTKADDQYSGDMLYYYDPENTEYKAWFLNSAGAWEATASVTLNGITPGVIATEQTAPRGCALIIVRKNPTTSNPVAPVPIFLYGQYAAGNVDTPITAGAWNLIAPSMSADAVLTPTGSEVQNVTMTGTPAAGDYIVLSSNPAQRYYYDSSNGWGYTPPIPGANRVNGLAIPAGTGAWYVSSATSYKPPLSFNW